MKNVAHNFSHFHDSEDSNCGFLDYDSIQSSSLVPTFGRNTAYISRAKAIQIWTQYFPPKHYYSTTPPHAVTIQTPHSKSSQLWKPKI
jgi:hypothetical protein